MTLVYSPSELRFELPGGRPTWRVTAVFNGTECEFRAETGGQAPHRSLWKIAPDQLRDRGEDASLDGANRAPEQRWVQDFAGFVRVYRRRFRDISAREQERYEVGADELLAFLPAQDGTALELVVREIEDLLFFLAQVREQSDVLEQSSTVTLPLPMIDVWEQYEPLIAASTDAMAQRLYPMLTAFHLKHEELRDLLGQRPMPFLPRVSRTRLSARLTRLDILGTQAIWAFEDARRVESITIAGRSLETAPEPTAGGAPWPRAHAVHIEWLHLDHIRRFEKLILEFQPQTDQGAGQWILLLGENGTGKTTLLRAIALALIEPDFAQSFVTQTSADAPLVRIETQQPREYLNPESRPSIGVCVNPGLSLSHVWLTSVQGRERFEVNHAPAVRPPVFAYGCRRGNALGGPEREVDFNPLGNVATLFDPQAHLVHAEAWLRKLAFAAEKDRRDRALFEAVLDLLTDRDGNKEDPLLPGVREIDVTPDRTWVLGPGDRRVPLSALSDGYLTTLGWLVDFLARWLEYARRNDYEIGPDFAAEMPAVVLVDELDLHLHPRWQMQVVPALARTFPRTTFIATTHNPLTLSGTVGDERMRGAVHIIKERADGNLDIVQRDLPPGMNADEVLTDEWFGLRSTLDRETLELLDKHRALLRQGVAEEHPDRRALEAELRRRLGSYADTPAERLAQTLVAKQFPDDVPEVDDLPEEELDRLSKLYEAAVARARGEGKSPPEQP
jgi:energy-coupling factor transporter ATP-binding protein EcfA2